MTWRQCLLLVAFFFFKPDWSTELTLQPASRGIIYIQTSCWRRHTHSAPRPSDQDGFWCLFTHKNTAFCSKRIAINFERSQAIFRWEVKGSGAASCFSCIMSRFPLSLAGAEVYRSRWKKAVRRRAPDRRQVELKKRPAAPQPVRRLINRAVKQSQPRCTVDRP